MAELCIAADADKTLIQRWIDLGRQQADAATAIPHMGLPQTVSGLALRHLHTGRASGPADTHPRASAR